MATLEATCSPEDVRRLIEHSELNQKDKRDIAAVASEMTGLQCSVRTIVHLSSGRRRLGLIGVSLSEGDLVVTIDGPGFVALRSIYGDKGVQRVGAHLRGVTSLTLEGLSREGLDHEIRLYDLPWPVMRLRREWMREVLALPEE